jgi:hypothetical protein
MAAIRTVGIEELLDIDNGLDWMHGRRHSGTARCLPILRKGASADDSQVCEASKEAIRKVALRLKDAEPDGA